MAGVVAQCCLAATAGGLFCSGWHQERVYLSSPSVG